MPLSPSRSVAVLDDEPGLRTALARLLRLHGFEVVPFASGPELLAELERRPFDALLLDLHMPEPDGFEVLSALARRVLRPAVIVITGHDTPEDAARCLALGARLFLPKPLTEATLLDGLREVLAPTAPLTH